MVCSRLWNPLLSLAVGQKGNVYFLLVTVPESVTNDKGNKSKFCNQVRDSELWPKRKFSYQSAASKESHPGRVGVQADLMVTRSVGSEGEAAL